MGVHPTDDTELTLCFLPQIRNNGDGQADDFTNNDTVKLTVTAGKHTEVMQDIISAINGGPHSDGFIVVADDATTDADDTTKAAIYVSSHITACAAIAIGTAFS